MSLRYLKLILEGEELDRPELRCALYHREGPRKVVRPVPAFFWVNPSSATFGSLEEADWSRAGFDEPVRGSVYIGLLPSGKTQPLMLDAAGGRWFIVIDGYAFWAVAAEWISPVPEWPWRVIPWADKYGLMALLGQTICLWPENPDGSKERILEPLQVVTIYVQTESKQYGIGLIRASAATEELQMELRALEDVPSTETAVRKVDLTAILRPELVLWAPGNFRTPGLNVAEVSDGITVWRSQEAVGEFLILCPDSYGSIPPDIWPDMADPFVTGDDSETYCPECVIEGRPYVPALLNGYCVEHATGRKSYTVAHATQTSSKTRNKKRLETIGKPPSYFGEGGE